jgi:gliding motility-associated-like protein
MRNLIGAFGFAFVLVFLVASPVKAQWHFPVIPGPGPNSASSLGNDCILLTPQSTNVRGVVWDSVQLDLTQPFDISLSVMMGPQTDYFGADGLALVLQRQGLNAYGAGGNGLGYSGAFPADPFYTSITPSIAFELDTWENGAPVADIPQQHIAIHQNGVITSALAGPTPAFGVGGGVNDSTCRTYRVVWTPGSNNIRIFFPTATNLRLNANIDMINTVFSGNSNVWWGITGVSGAPAQTTIVCVGAQFAHAGLDTATCPGEPLQLQASGGVNYYWGQGFPIINNQNIPNPTFTSLIPLPYYLSVLVTNIAGCQDRDSVTVNVEPFPNANTGNPGTICLGDSFQLGGPPNNDYSYQWTPNTNLSGTTVAQPWVLPITPGTINYQLVVTDTSGMAACTDTASIAVVATDTPTVSLVATPDTICNGSIGTLTATATGGTGSYSYAWSPGGGTTASVQVNPSTTTTYSVTVTDQSSCSTVGSITLTVLASPTVSAFANPDTICAGQTSDLTAQASGGLVPYNYLWSNSQTGSVTTVSPQITTNFTVTVTDANGCSGTASAPLVVNVADSIDITVPDTFVCNNGAIAITNTFGSAGVNTWTWLPAVGVSDPTVPNPVISPPVDTTYYLSGFNSISGCGYIDSIHIDVFELNLNLWSDSTICLGDSINLDLQIGGGSGNYVIQWLSTSGGYISDDSIANPVVSPSTNTIYTALVTDTTNGCVSTQTVNVNVSQLQVQASPSNITINPGQSVQLQAIGAMFYVWSPDTSINCITCPDPVVAPEGSILYTVLGYDTSGCRGTATVNIVADSLVVPNVFTPNGDGINDELLFNYYGNAFYQIAVYDRWGKQIFNTTDKNAMWNGKTGSGADAPEGVYYVSVRIVGDAAIPDEMKQKVFAVTLLR